MKFAPQHDFVLFDTETSRSRLLLAKNATLDEKFDQFSELRLIASFGPKPLLERCEIGERWLREKIPLRIKMLAAFGRAENAK